MTQTYVPTETPTKILKQLVELEGVVSALQPTYSAFRPNVTGDPNVARRLIDAVKAAFPAETHILIARFGDDAIHIDGDVATITHEGEQLQLPVDALVDYWVDVGHRINM